MQSVTTADRDLLPPPTESTRIFNRTTGSIEVYENREWRSVSDSIPVLGYLTSTQRDALASPAIGTLIYNETDNQWESYDGSSWSTLALSPITLMSWWIFTSTASGTTPSSVAYSATSSTLIGEGTYIPVEATIVKVIGMLDSDGSEPTAMSIHVYGRNAAGTETTAVRQDSIPVTYSIAGFPDVSSTAPTKVFVVTETPAATVAAGSVMMVKVSATGGSSPDARVVVVYSVASV